MSRFVSYAQNYEDVILWRALGHVKNGFFVDCGAYDPSCHSVTKAFYDRGWRGINVEPVPCLFQKFSEERPRDINLNIALSDKSGYATFYEIVDTGLSTFDKQIACSHVLSGCIAKSTNVRTKRLSDILQESSEETIHFLKIDVEGAEKLVLDGLDLANFRPWVILIEATKPTSEAPSHEEWEHQLLSHGYDFVYFDGLNRFYVSNDHPELRAPLAVAPNIFDNFVQVEHLIELEHLQNQLAALKDSTSWRMTAPIRAAKDTLRSLPKIVALLAAYFSAVKLSRELDFANVDAREAARQKLSKHLGHIARSA